MPAAEAAEAAPGTKHGLLLNGVSGNTLNRANQAGTFAGTILIKRVALDSETRTLKIYGLVNGIATTGGTPQTITNQKFAAMALLAGGASGSRAAPAASCSILNLTIGRIHLNLLGLVIDVPNPIVLNITGLTGAGELLGNLLCALAGLLNPGLGGLGPILNLLANITSLLSRVLVPIGGAAVR